MLSLLYESYFLYTSNKLSGGTLRFYGGFPLLLFLCRVIAHYVVTIASGILFWINHPKTKWVFLIFLVFILVIEPLWMIKPNTNKVRQEFNKVVIIGKNIRILSRQEHRDIPRVTKVYAYPFRPIKIFYILAGIYIFLIDTKLFAKYKKRFK